jgi:hypothetical protein
LSFRGRKINRVAREGTYNTIRKRQEQTLDETRELLRLLLRSINSCNSIDTHRLDIQRFFKGEEEEEIVRHMLESEEKEQTL